MKKCNKPKLYVKQLIVKDIKTCTSKRDRHEKYEYTKQNKKPCANHIKCPLLKTKADENYNDCPYNYENLI